MKKLIEEVTESIRDFDGKNLSQLRALVDRFDEIKIRAREEGDEETANECWRYASSLNLNIQFSEIFLLLKSKKYPQAWKALEDCEIAAKDLDKNCGSKFLEGMQVKYIIAAVSRWQSIFPYNLFLSPGFTVGYHTCSICGHKIRPRSRCSHKKGYLYNGEVCRNIRHDVKIHEVSVVTNPVQKFSVVTGQNDFDYSLLDYVCACLNSPYDRWSLKWTKKSYPRERFFNVSSGDLCPCKSGETFYDCCSSKDSVFIPHVDVILSGNLPASLPENVFPY